MSVQEQQDKIKVASIQMQVISAEPLKNMVRAEGFINDAVSAGANALLLPELWTTGYSLDRFDALADEFHDSTLSFLQDAARRYHVSIIGGSFPEKRANGVYSTCYSIGPDGAVLASYSKEHLFPLLKEPQYLQPGVPGSVTQTPAGRWASLICFDIRFPESARELAYRGARILWVPAEWPHVRLEHWRTLLRARAIENQLFVVASNRCGTGDDTRWGGHSTIIDPWGNIMVEAEEDETVLVADLDMAMVDEVRTRIPCFETRVVADRS
ncbi:MAG TPA: carbon-nitrogen family hydrolase [Chloroflexia bacterium]|nr:carbon-nitrogen family hydrolase [Chloroflexia bacterium]